MRCIVSCGRTSFPWLVFSFGALLWGSLIHKHTGRWMQRILESNWTQVLESCDWMKLLSIHFDLCKIFCKSTTALWLLQPLLMLLLLLLLLLVIITFWILPVTGSLIICWSRGPWKRKGIWWYQHQTKTVDVQWAAAGMWRKLLNQRMSLWFHKPFTGENGRTYQHSLSQDVKH